MREHRVTVVCSILLLALGMGLVSLAESAGQQANQPASEVQLLTGKTWQELSRDHKIAYIWGIGNLVELERTNLGSQQPQPPTGDRKSFIPHLAYGLSGISIAQIVDRVDAYYKAHPDQLNQPVLNAIFQDIVMPRLKEARAGARGQ
jgi:hypothetical protein